MGYFMTMIQVNIADAKAHLSEYIERVQDGEVVLICKRNVPIAELRRLPERPPARRKFGGYKGQIAIHEAFFEPLPDEELNLWDGTEAG